MSLEARLERCKKYREQAIKHPRANKLYIEDLDLSIKMFESAITNKKDISVLHGFVDNDE